MSNNMNSTSPSEGNWSSGVSFSKSSVPDFIQLIFFALAIILSIFYIILICLRRTFRNNKLNWFTMNICFMSALLSIVMIMMTIKRLNNLSSIIPCRFEGFLIDMVACQMMYSHGVAALSRQFTVVYTNKRIFRSTMGLWSFIGSGWLISIILALPYLFVDGYTCSTTNSSNANFLPYYTIFNTFLLPIMIVGICNCHIFLHVHRSSRKVHADGQSSGVSHARDIHLLKIMIGTFSIFFFGWAPVFLTQIFGKNNDIPEALDACFQILPSLATLFDVIFLIYTNEPVRLFIKQVVFRPYQRKANKLVRISLQQNIHTITNQ